MTSGPDAPDRSDVSGRTSAFGLLNLALDHVGLLIGVPLAAAVLAFLLATVIGPEYSAQSTFVPESESASLGELGGLASQLGFGAALIGGQDESVDFYARLATSRALLEEVARQTYRFPEELDAEGTPAVIAGTLPDLLDVKGDTPEERLRKTVNVLSKRVQVEADRTAGLVQVRTVAPWAALAVELNRAVLDAVSRFNLEKRQSSAGAERAFIENQVQEARKDLLEAEGELQRFLEENRRYENLPELRFQANRLERRVDLLQQLYTSLQQSLQNARIEEVRTTPTITVISPPQNSAEKATSRVRTAILGFLLGLAAVVGYLFLHEYTARQREQDPGEYERFRARRARLLRRS